MRGYQGNKTTAEYVIRQSNCYDLGFRRSGDNYELVADFWGANIDENAFINAINQKYAHKMLMQSVVDQGFNVEEEETLEDGTGRKLWLGGYSSKQIRTGVWRRKGVKKAPQSGRLCKKVILKRC